MIFTVSFALYTLAIVAVGVASARRATTSDEDYYLAGRSLGPWIAALSASASSESGWVTLGLVGMAFQNGYAAYWIMPGCLVGFAFNWFVIAGRLRTRAHDLGAITVPDFFARHFDERRPILRTATVVVILVAMWMYVAAQFAAAGKTFESSFGVPYFAGVVLGAVIVLAYVVVGGFRAACWTDFAQAIVMVGALAVFPAWILATNGGFAFAHERLDPALLTMRPSESGLALIGFLLGANGLGINFGFPGQPHVLVRFMAMRDATEARIGGAIALTWAVLIFWGAITTGILVRAMTEGGAAWTAPLAGGDGETALIEGARHLLPGVISGMVLAAVMSAICSTADSQLVVAASAAVNDVYARLFDRSPRASHLLINRLVVLALGIGAVLLVIDPDVSVFSFVTSYGWAVLGAGIGPQLILVLLWKRASYAGCIAGMATGFTVALVWKNVPALDALLYNLPAAFIAALLVNAIVSALTAPPKR